MQPCGWVESPPQAVHMWVTAFHAGAPDRRLALQPCLPQGCHYIPHSAGETYTQIVPVHSSPRTDLWEVGLWLGSVHPQVVEVVG